MAEHLLTISAADIQRGWVEFVCPTHGQLVVTMPEASVTCMCGKRAYPARNGRRVPRTSLHRMKRSRKSLQIEGSDFARSPVSAEKA